MLTAYTKVVVVLGLLRNALGVQQVPPSIVLNGIAIVVSAYVVAPVGMDVYDRMHAQAGVQEKGMPQVTRIFEAAKEPITEFLKKHAHERERAFFVKSAKALWPPERAQRVDPDDLIVLAPAFTLSELSEAFTIGFLLYMAFVVVDLIVANILLALGLSQVTPTQISIPFKLLLFVVLDGWSVLVHGLIMTYR
jgi:type III secretion protein R